MVLHEPGPANQNEFFPTNGFIPDSFISCPGGWSQTIPQVKKPDVEVLDWHDYTWFAVVRPVGRTVKFSKTTLEAAHGENENEIIWQQLCWTFLQSACQLHAPSKLETSVALCCVANYRVAFYCPQHSRLCNDHAV